MIVIKKCLNCNSELKTGQVKYCSRSCSVTINNKLKIKEEITCDFCKKKYKGKSNSKYCSKLCSNEDKKHKNISKWLCGDDLGYKSKNVVLKTFIRNYLFEIRGTACSSCGFDVKHPIDNKTINEIDHIDGDASNNSIDNLRILCPNCHALTSTFRARNKNSKRNRK